MSGPADVDDHDDDLTKYTRHPDFWLEDGNIVLVASRTTAFRVHRSVLSRKSNVFQDMFSFPQPGASVPDPPSACPVLHLPDAPEDLAYFFDAMYNGMRYRFSKDCRPTWAAVKALLLLGNKYDAAELQDEALRCLSRQFPTSIDEWDAVYDEGGFISGRRDALPIEIANLCRFLRLPAYHIPALYLCCTLPTKTLKHGVPAEGEGDGADGGGDGDAARVKLNAEDLAVCIRAKKALRRALEQNLAALVEAVPSEEGALCHDEDECDATVRRLQKGERWPRGLGSRPYSALDSFWWIIDSIEDLCNNCTDWYHAQYAELRQGVRNSLDTYIIVPAY